MMGKPDIQVPSIKKIPIVTILGKARVNDISKIEDSKSLKNCKLEFESCLGQGIWGFGFVR